MAYIGNTPAEKFSAFSKQDFTTSATTSYTLDNAVSNANEIALFINHVRQEPTTAYTAAGTALTLTSATTSSDDMYCVYLGKAIQTVNPANSSITNAMLSETITVANGGTGATTLAGAGLSNTPSFLAEFANSTEQSISANTITKVQYTEEVFDTDNKYDNSTNYRFTPGVAGKYFMFASIATTTSNDMDTLRIAIRKNGTEIRSFNNVNRNKQSASISVIVESNTTDYFEIYCELSLAKNLGNSFGNNGDANYFGAYRIGA